MPSKAAMIRVTLALAVVCPIWLSACGSSTKRSTVPAACPSPQALASVSGATFGAPTTRRTSASLACLYQQGGIPLSVAINTTNLSASQFRAGEDAAATASHLTPSTVANLGSAAFLLASANSTDLTVLAKGHVITLAGGVTSAQAEAIAHYLVNQVSG